MVKRGKGVLIFTSSGAAIRPAAGWSAYCTAKAGLDHSVRTLVAEIDQQRLSVGAYSVYPRVVDSAMQEQIRGKVNDEFGRVDQVHAYHRRGVLRPPEEPAAIIWWLATPMAVAYDGQSVSFDDRDIRRHLADDQGTTGIPGRGA